jgi:cytochrome oxidase Cu insertion factor (SCO1/SenC/PrrC family)
MMKRQRLGRVVVLLVAAGALAIWTAVTGQGDRALRLGAAGDSRPGTLEVLGRYAAVPDFRLTERSGRAVSRADLLGTVWVASFVSIR